MFKFFQSLQPEQWAIIVGLISPLVQFALGKLKDFSSTHNWLLSFVLPFLGSLAVFLSTNPGFNHLVPLYATVYTMGQTIYFTSVRWWVKYSDLLKATTSADQVV